MYLKYLRQKEIFFLSDSTTRPSDLPLNVIVESGNSQAKVVLQMTPPLFGAKWKSPQISLIDSHVKSIFFTKQGCVRKVR